MVSLQNKLRDVMGHLAMTARTSKLISINAALAAGRGAAGGRGEDAAAFRTVALEIQRLSEQSESGITELNAVLQVVRNLSQTINLAGRQRMLSQKVMKVHLIARELNSVAARREETQLIDEFESAQVRLEASPLNTPAIREGMAVAMAEWRRFRAALERGDLTAAITANEALLEALHATVLAYEAMAE